MKIEVEVKARLKNREAVMKKLQDQGFVFGEPVTQEDTVYSERVGTLDDFMSNKIFLRLRTKNKTKTIFTLKRPLDKTLNKVEWETAVDSRDEMEHALFEMGYKKAVQVDKVRLTIHKELWEICIDEVKDLGDFIEVEKMTENESAKKIQDELYAFLDTLGIAKEDRVTEGYDILMIRKLESQPS